MSYSRQPQKLTSSALTVSGQVTTVWSLLLLLATGIVLFTVVEAALLLISALQCK
jgi:hypothetical protein